jgi:hypothetical protein
MVIVLLKYVVIGFVSYLHSEHLWNSRGSPTYESQSMDSILSHLKQIHSDTSFLRATLTLCSCPRSLRSGVFLLHHVNYGGQHCEVVYDLLRLLQVIISLLPHFEHPESRVLFSAEKLSFKTVQNSYNYSSVSLLHIWNRIW